MLDMDRRQSTTMASLPNRVGMPVLSPDGHWLGFTGWIPVRPSIFVRPVTGDGPVRQLIEGAGYTVWNHAGDKIYFRSRRGVSRSASDDGIFELPFDPVRGVATGPEDSSSARLSLIRWGCPGSTSRVTAAFCWCSTTSGSPCRVTQTFFFTSTMNCGGGQRLSYGNGCRS